MLIDGLGQLTGGQLRSLTITLDNDRVYPCPLGWGFRWKLRRALSSLQVLKISMEEFKSIQPWAITVAIEFIDAASELPTLELFSLWYVGELGSLMVLPMLQRMRTLRTLELSHDLLTRRCFIKLGRFIANGMNMPELRELRLRLTADDDSDAHVHLISGISSLDKSVIRSGVVIKLLSEFPLPAEVIQRYRREIAPVEIYNIYKVDYRY